MSFSNHFEKKVNEEMMHEDGQPGRAPAEMEDADMALKKNGDPSSQMDGHDSHDKKDYPPRFSTLFGVAPPAPPPPPPHTPREYVREHDPEPKRRSGVHMPLALFIVLMITLFFESTIIFAYTIIGLYNNAPARLFPWAGQGTAVAATCGSSSQQQPAINIAPNFVMPGRAGAEQQHVTTELITITATPSTSSSSTSISTSTTNASSQAAAMASDIADILGSLGLGGASWTTSSSIALVTVKPTQSTVTSVTLITETPPGPTVTQTTVVDAPKGTASSTTEQEEIIIRPTTLSSSAA
ncbi:hypothetical protein CBER1_08763 [Cercospora berteroae]|uniref:Uncharacterized protein n=1 Tax=Cercospora berteroae TaxID=357750 RepID=A0A2S6BW17_9PEZI|nr:hypothetical protein CBER1_08763 [Cercospora berteroae]